MHARRQKQAPRVITAGNSEMLKEFKDFISKGNVMDLAVGIIIGAAFTAIAGKHSVLLCHLPCAR